jgi:NACHT domain
MDHILAVELAVKVSTFVDFATKCFSSTHNLHKEPTKTEGEQDQDIASLIDELRQHTEAVRYQLPQGVSLLSQEDELCFRIANQCQSLSSHLLISLNDINTSNIAEPHKDEEIGVLFSTIEADLNEHLASLLWPAISQTARELGAKNSRLNANRTKVIEDLTAHTNAYFQGIKMDDLDGHHKTDLWSYILTAVEAMVDYSAEQLLLSVLQFWTMDRRKELIPKEHENTFEWILSEGHSEDSSLPVVNFTEWLSSNEPVYWISGKPGSGKSTLMKYISGSLKTMNHLTGWARDETLITASFYFWSSAKDPLQKSSTGLLRSIMFQILRQCPDLIQHAYPNQWQERHDRGSLHRFSQIDPTTAELLSAYRRIAGLLPTTKVKFCFFIDGLDEYDGEPADIVKLIESLSKTKNLKACISSRPWSQFENVFGGNNPWKLYVHELTNADMEVYVADLFGNNDKFTMIQERDDAKLLMKEIVVGAEGVFLWVFLVVRSLLSGLTEMDGIIDLQRRLETIPNSLENYFDKMLSDIDPAMREQTAEVFQITLNATEKLPLMCYWLIQNETMNSVMEMEPGSLPNTVAITRLAEALKWLDTYSLGLLTANGVDGEFSQHSDLEEHQWLFEFRVDFLHRTVADFLRTADMKKMLSKWSAESFSVDLQITKACLATIKSTPPTSSMFGEASRALQCLHLFLSHTKYLEESLQNSFLDVIVLTLKMYHHDDLENIVAIILGPGNYWAFNASYNFSILFHCISYGLGKYVASKLNKKVLGFPEPLSGLLSGCFSFDNRVRMDNFTSNMDTIELLLERDLDPNLTWGDRNFSFWQQLLTTTYSRFLKGAVTQINYDIIKSAVNHGADLEALVEVFSRQKLGRTRAIDILEKILPKEQFLALRVATI